MGLVSSALPARAQLNAYGQRGLINMPDARIGPEGTLRFGLSYLDPYVTGWSSVSLLDWFEATGRYTRIMHVPGFPNRPETKYGDYKDKSVDFKLRLTEESARWPSIAFGMTDIQGTNIFVSRYLVASKRIGNVDLTAGFGAQRIKGLFGGMRYSPESLPNWNLVAEYNAIDFKSEPFAAQSGANRFKNGPAVGLEYRWGWLGAQVSYQPGPSRLGVNAYVSIPLEQKEFIPKIQEPDPYVRVRARPTLAMWNADPGFKREMFEVLREQDFRNVSFAYRDGKMIARLTNIRISQTSRAVGRAARILLAFAPTEAREIRITYTQGTLPVVTYSFFDLPTLQRYFNGMASRQKLTDAVAIEYAAPGAERVEDRDEALAAFVEPAPTYHVGIQREGDIIALRREDNELNLLNVRPYVSSYLNDPSGAFKFDVSVLGIFSQRLGPQTTLDGDVKLTLWESVSDVTQPSNSLLPQVRSSIAEYKRGSIFKLERLLLNHFLHPSERVYARLSAGIYEEMFSGAGGQVLYLPRSGAWGADLSVDWLKQRDVRGWFGFRPYSTLTAIGALHYRLGKGMTATARAGRFLARDEGVRFEVKRRFASGFEVGAWYTFTNGNDITSPGSPSSPYHDKGIFMLIPLNTMLTQDTRAAGGFALAPWTRDVGQMVVSPGDLYDMMERPLMLDFQEKDRLVRFGDMEDDYNLPSLGAGASAFDRPVIGMTLRDWSEGVGELVSGRTLRAMGVGLGMTLASAAFDQRAFRYADDHKNSQWVKRGVKFGDALPIAGMGLSALLALGEKDARLSNAALASVQAGGTALLLNSGAKYTVGRARPIDGLGRSDFSPFKRAGSSFPSNHVATMWAVVTPYAQEYELPWLYGAAALTNLARIGSREHWVSDTVAGSLLGYMVGSYFWDRRRKPEKGEPTVSVGPGGVTLAWEFK